MQHNYMLHNNIVRILHSMICGKYKLERAENCCKHKQNIVENERKASLEFYIGD